MDAGGERWLAQALAGDEGAVRSLIAQLLPIVQARATRGIWRRQRGALRDARQEVDDLVQEVFAALFADDARALRAWEPGRGLSLSNFVGLIAEREVASLLRTGRRNPWTEDPTPAEDLASALGGTEREAGRLLSRDLLLVLVDRLRERLSARGWHLFRALVIEEKRPEVVAAELQMTIEAVYAWRGRFARTARAILEEVQAIPPSARPEGLEPLDRRSDTNRDRAMKAGEP